MTIALANPKNGAAPDRLPGGSAAVAGRLVDSALRSDAGGSARRPASIRGERPTAGRVATDEVVPLAPSLDTVGWFAREPKRSG